MCEFETLLYREEHRFVAAFFAMTLDRKPSRGSRRIIGYGYLPLVHGGKDGMFCPVDSETRDGTMEYMARITSRIRMGGGREKTDPRAAQIAVLSNRS